MARSRKKRRTEVSSDESSSDSDSDSGSEQVQVHQEQHEQEQEHEQVQVQIQGNTEGDAVTGTISGLRMDGPAVTNTTTTAEETSAAVLETRRRLRELQRQVETETEKEGGAATNGAPAAVADWLSEMLGQYGDDVDTLRRAGDFGETSVALVAEMLRSSSAVFTKQP